MRVVVDHFSVPDDMDERICEVTLRDPDAMKISANVLGMPVRDIAFVKIGMIESDGKCLSANCWLVGEDC